MSLSINKAEVIEYSDMIFAAVLVGGIDTSNSDLVTAKREVFHQALARFKDSFRKCIFLDVYSVFYDIIIKSSKNVFTANMLSNIIDSNQSEILSSPFISFFDEMDRGANGNVVTDDEKIMLFKEKALEEFDRLSNMHIYLDDFDSACESYITEYYNAEYMDVLGSTFEIANGIEIKDPVSKQKFVGIDQSRKYFTSKMMLLDEEVKKAGIEIETREDEWLRERNERRIKKDDSDLLFKTGIDEIDSVIGHVKRSNIIQFMGPTKGGKTKMCAYLAEKALSEGLNVTIWPLEGKASEWDDMMLASGIMRKYNKRIPSNVVGSVNIKDGDVLKLITAAETNLAMGKDRGKVTYIKGTLYTETFIDVLSSHYKNNNPFDIIIIDSLLLAMSDVINKKNERISEAYVMLKNYLANVMKGKNQAAAILTAQLKPAVVKKLLEDKDTDIDAVDGAESAETTRTPDYTIGLFSTKEERRAGVQRISDVANRHSVSFETSYIEFDYSCCFAKSNPDLNT